MDWRDQACALQHPPNYPRLDTNMNRIRRIVLATATALFVAPALAACPTTPPEPTVVIIGRDDFKVLGISVKTAAELRKTLVDNKVKQVDISFDEELGYEGIGKVIYGLSGSGVEIHAVNGKVRKR